MSLREAIPTRRSPETTGTARRLPGTRYCSTRSSTEALGPMALVSGRMTSRTVTPARRCSERTCRSCPAPAPCRNQPITAIQIPLSVSPPRTQTTPRMMSPYPTSCPTATATSRPRRMLPVTCHTAARSTRPPSRGKPGIRLNPPSSPLTSARYPKRAATRGSPTTTAMRKQPPASTRLVSGPTTAIRNSVEARGASVRRLETPPNRNSVIEAVPMPRVRATSEWASSWTKGL